MRVAILCNGPSDKTTDRIELVHQLKEEKHEVYIGGVYTGKMHKYYSKDNAEFISLKASRNNTNPLVEILSIFSVKSELSKRKIDATIVYGVKNHAAMVIGSKLANVKRVLCVVNGSGNLFRITGIKGFVLRFISFPMLRIAYALSDNVCFQNHDDYQLFIDKHLIRKNKRVFFTGGSGVNTDIFSSSELPAENRFLFLARITPTKGIFDYIKAAKIVKKSYPQAEFSIVGPLDSVVETEKNELLREAEQDGTVVYHGPTDNVPECLSWCRYFVYPSYYPEGVPRCAIQALSSGRPIITCDTPGCKETVIDGINGFLIPAQDFETLARKMIWFIEHPLEIEKMAIESRKYAEEKFDVMTINKTIIERLFE